jgi:prephenate dehydratase
MTCSVLRAGYLGPPGTFTHEALVGALGGCTAQLVPVATVRDAVLAVRDRELDRALVPIENSLEGAVTATLDTLALEAPEVTIAAELVRAISQCLIARSPLRAEEIEVVASHPQATGQCRRYLRERLPQAQIRTASSTAEAVRLVAEHGGRWAAIGNRLAAELYGCLVLASDVQDEVDNRTRFVWLAPQTSADCQPPDPRGADRPAGSGEADRPACSGAPWKTAIVFWGAGSDSPGWLVACLTELARRQVNLTRIESRPRRKGLGSYMFFADLDGHVRDPDVAAGLEGLRAHVESLRVLGCFPAARPDRATTLS